ncbi:MAG: hypothetical protein NZ484_01420 [Patescibacteria group bacterium]|nr:hypothetical protein [Patescibacteria group bacterium]MCX7589797.1 hypothetical protein [Patescibacteria group bacterium]MDW8279843.1 hypothetical protein [bacterium]
MNNFEFKNQIENIVKPSLEQEYLDIAILIIYLNKWINKNMITENQKIIDLIKLIENNQKDFKNKEKLKNIKTKDENLFKQINFFEKKLFKFLEKNHLSLENKISELLKTAKNNLAELKNIIQN